MTIELGNLAHLGQEWLAFSLVLAAQLLLVLALRNPVRAQLGAVACYRLWLLPLVWLPLYFLGPVLLAALATPDSSSAANSAAPYQLALQQFTQIELLPFEFADVGSTSLAAGGDTQIQGWSVLALVWVAGSVALIVWHGRRWLAFSREVRVLSTPLSSGERVAVGTDAHFAPQVPVLRLRGMNSAALFGVFKPALLLPENFRERYDNAQRHIILAHESVHLRRGDNGWNLCALLLIALFWTNPLVFIAWRYFRLDQELSCDALALARCTKAQQKRYARTLLDSLGTLSAYSTQPVLSAWDNLRDIKERSLMVTKHLHTATRPLATLFSLLSLAALGASLTITFAELVSPVAQAAEEPTPVSGQVAREMEQEARQVRQQELQVEQQARQVRQQELQVEQQARQVEQQARQVEQQARQAEQQQQQVVQQARQVDQQARQAEQQARQVEQQQQQVEQQARQEALQAQLAAERTRQETRQAQLAAERTRLEIESAQQAEQAAQSDSKAAAQEQQPLQIAQAATQVAQDTRQAAQQTQVAAQVAEEAPQQRRATTTERARAARPRGRLGLMRDNEDNGTPVLDQQTGEVFADAIELLNQDQFDAARERLGTLRVNRLSDFERSRYEQLMFNVSMNEENYPEARAHLQAALDSRGLNEDESSMVSYQLAQLYVQEEKYPEAAEALEAWIANEETPQYTAYYLLAASYFYQDQFERALAPAEKAVELGTTSGRPMQEAHLSILSALYIENRKFEDAERVLAEMVELFPGKGSYAQQLADVKKLNAAR